MLHRHLGDSNSQCKGPEVGVSLVCLENQVGNRLGVGVQVRGGVEGWADHAGTLDFSPDDMRSHWSV